MRSMVEGAPATRTRQSQSHPSPCGEGAERSEAGGGLATLQL